MPMPVSDARCLRKATNVLDARAENLLVRRVNELRETAHIYGSSVRDAILGKSNFTLPNFQS